MVVILPVMLVVLLSLSRDTARMQIPACRDITGEVGGVAVTASQQNTVVPNPRGRDITGHGCDVGGH